MEVPGTCQLCQKVGSMHTCKLCGLLVCAQHYHQTQGACTNCKPAPATGSDRPDQPGSLPRLPPDAGERRT